MGFYRVPVPGVDTGKCGAGFFGGFVLGLSTWGWHKRRGDWCRVGFLVREYCKNGFSRGRYIPSSNNALLQGNPSKLQYICIVWFNQNGSHLMTPVFRESEFIIECFVSFWIFQIEKHYISPGGVWNLTLPEANMTLGFESIFWKEVTSISSTFVFQLVFCIFFHTKPCENNIKVADLSPPSAHKC